MIARSYAGTYSVLVGMVLLLSQLVLHAQTSGDLYHLPPESGTEGEDLELTVSVTTQQKIIEANLYYREAGDLSYREQPLYYRDGGWVGIIPGDYLTPNGLEYVIILKTQSGGIYATPSETPFETPHFVPIKSTPESGRSFPGSDRVAGRRTISADVLILSPEPGDLVPPDEVVIAVSLFNVPDVDTNSIRVYIDGDDYTSETEISEGIINLVPEKLDVGFHNVRITMSTDYGSAIQPTEWSFTVSKSGFGLLDRIAYNGDINTRMSSEYAGESILNISEIKGKIEGGITWVNMKGTFRLTSRESPYQQPLNRLNGTINLGEYLTIQAGDFNPSLNAFTIDGKRVRGLGVNVRLPWFRFQVVRGQLNRAIQWAGEKDRGYYLLSQETKTDSVNQATYYLDRRGYVFRRDINAYRLVVDMYSRVILGLHVLKAKDQVESVKKIISPSATFTVDTLAAGIDPGTYTLDQFQSAVDTAGGILVLPEKKWGGGDPEDNLVMGFDLGSTFDQQKLVFEFSWNISLYNRNIWDGAMTRAEMDTTLDDSLDGFIGVQYDESGLVTGTPLKIDTASILDPATYEGLFTVNAFMTPLLPFDFSAFQKQPITTVINMPSSAFHLRLKGRYPRNNFLIEYRQIGPEYVSLGNPYLTSNLREFILQNRLSLLDNKLQISASYKHRDNKILRTTLDPLNTNTFSTSVTLVPGPGVPSFMFNVQSIGKDNEKKKIESSGMDLREDSRAVNSLLSINFPVSFLGMKHSFVVNYSEVNNKDLLAAERKNNYLFQKTDSKTYSVNLSSRFVRPLRTTLSFSRTDLFLPIMKNGIVTKLPYTWTAFAMNGSYLLRENTLRLNGGFSYLHSAGSVETSLFGVKLGGEMKIIEQLSLSVSGNLELSHTGVFKDDMQDNDGDGKIDEWGEPWGINASGMLLTLGYKF